MSGELAMSCDGSCCAAFYLPRTISRLRRDPDVPPDVREWALEALVPLSPKEASERSARFSESPERFAWASRGHHFTCTHWDEESRRCTNYDRRPSTCRSYPGGEGGCAWGCDEQGTPMQQAIREAQAARV